jgi:hypothetical protein
VVRFVLLVGECRGEIDELPVVAERAAPSNVLAAVKVGASG